MRPALLGTAALLIVGCLVLIFANESRSQNAGLVRLESNTLPSSARAPDGNPATPARIALGRLLFWDPILSGQQDVACATCHHPDFGYAENRDLSIGVDGIGLGHRRRFAPRVSPAFVKRNSQTILNVAFNGIEDGGRYNPATAPMFWDLRASGLEAQALEPIKTLEEMRGSALTESSAVADVVSRLDGLAEYRRIFGEAFGAARPITAEQLGRALAAFQRSLTAANAPFDRYMRGDRQAMTAAQLRGMSRFSRIGCVNLDPLLRQLRDPDDDAADVIAFLESLSDDSFDRTIPARVPSGLRPGGNIQ
jgi:cytochrome c peroxidase